MSWGTKRRNIVVFTFFLFIIIPVGIIAFLTFYNPPTCFDGKQNAEEEGIDCGRGCQLLCTNQVIKPVVLWERQFKINKGLYNLLAYVENPNPTAYVKDAQYLFKIYNEDNILIGEKRGVVSILPQSVTPIIENNIQTFEQVPTRTTFEFLGELVYEQVEPKDSIIVIKDEFIEDESTSPRIKAKIQNISLNIIQNIDVIVLVYDVFDNVLGTSSTFVNNLGSEETKDIIFTWPERFPDDVARIELIPLYDFK